MKDVMEQESLSKETSKEKEWRVNNLLLQAKPQRLCHLNLTPL